MNKQEAKRELLNLLVSIDNQDDLEDILNLLLTPNEYEEIITRLQIFKKLQANKPQREISEELGVSIATVTRGSRELQQKQEQIKKLFSLLEESKN